MHLFVHLRSVVTSGEWRVLQDSNLRPSGSKPDTLSS